MQGRRVRGQGEKEGDRVCNIMMAVEWLGHSVNGLESGCNNNLFCEWRKKYLPCSPLMLSCSHDISPFTPCKAIIRLELKHLSLTNLCMHPRQH